MSECGEDTCTTSHAFCKWCCPEEIHSLCGAEIDLTQEEACHYCLECSVLIDTHMAEAHHGQV